MTINFTILGHDNLDKQHTILFGMFDRCKKALDAKNKEAVKLVVLDLVKFGLEHFRYEEELMINLKYPKNLYEEHVIQHSLFKAKMLEILQRKDDSGGHEILEYIVNWFATHVKVLDQKLVDYLNSI